MDDEEGYWLWTVSFENAGVYSARCPGCGRRVASDTFRAQYNEFTEDAKCQANCGKCGEFEPWHLCWPGEYTEPVA